MVDIIQKTRDDYNRIARHFSLTRNHAGELIIFRDLVRDGQNILDWGCGNGRLIYLFEGFAVNYFGVDQSNEQLKMARKNFPLKNAKFFCNAHKEKKFPENFFDNAFVIAALHHLPNPKTRLEVLKKIHRETKPGGKLVVTVWNLSSDWAKAKLKKDWKKIGKNDFFIPWKDQSGKLVAERYYHNFEKKELAGLLAEAGWKNAQLYYNTGDRRTGKKEGRNLVAVAEKV